MEMRVNIRMFFCAISVIMTLIISQADSRLHAKHRPQRQHQIDPPENLSAISYHNMNSQIFPRRDSLLNPSVPPAYNPQRTNIPPLYNPPNLSLPPNLPIPAPNDPLTSPPIISPNLPISAPYQTSPPIISSNLPSTATPMLFSTETSDSPAQLLMRRKRTYEYKYTKPWKKLPKLSTVAELDDEDDTSKPDVHILDDFKKSRNLTSFRKPEGVKGKQFLKDGRNHRDRTVVTPSTQRMTKMDNVTVIGNMDGMQDENKLQELSGMPKVQSFENEKDADSYQEHDGNVYENVTIVPIPEGIEVKSVHKDDKKLEEEMANITSSTKMTINADNSTEIENVAEMRMEKKVKELLETPTEQESDDEQFNERESLNLEHDNEQFRSTSSSQSPEDIEVKLATKGFRKQLDEIANINSRTKEIIKVNNSTEIEKVFEVQKEKKIQDELGVERGSEEIRIVETEHIRPMTINKLRDFVQNYENKKDSDLIQEYDGDEYQNVNIVPILEGTELNYKDYETLEDEMKNITSSTKRTINADNTTVTGKMVKMLVEKEVQKLSDTSTVQESDDEQHAGKESLNTEHDNEQFHSINFSRAPEGMDTKLVFKDSRKQLDETANIISRTEEVIKVNNSTEIVKVVEVQKKLNIQDKMGVNRGSEEIDIVEIEHIRPVPINMLKDFLPLNRKIMKNSKPMRYPKAKRSKRKKRHLEGLGAIFRNIAKTFIPSLTNKERVVEENSSLDSVKYAKDGLNHNSYQNNNSENHSSAGIEKHSSAHIGNPLEDTKFKKQVEQDTPIHVMITINNINQYDNESTVYFMVVISLGLLSGLIIVSMRSIHVQRETKIDNPIGRTFKISLEEPEAMLGNENNSTSKEEHCPQLKWQTEDGAWLV